MCKIFRFVYNCNCTTKVWECSYPNCPCPGLGKIGCSGKCPEAEKFKIFLPYTFCSTRNDPKHPSSNRRPGYLLCQKNSIQRRIPYYLQRVRLLRICRVDERLPTRIQCTRICDGCHQEKQADLTMGSKVMKKSANSPKDPKKQGLWLHEVQSAMALRQMRAR